MCANLKLSKYFQSEPLSFLTGVRHVIMRKLEGLQTSVKSQLIIFIRSKL